MTAFGIGSQTLTRLYNPSVHWNGPVQVVSCMQICETHATRLLVMGDIAGTLVVTMTVSVARLQAPNCM